MLEVVAAYLKILVVKALDYKPEDRGFETR
jgi:hypothetical protein